MNRTEYAKAYPVAAWLKATHTRCNRPRKASLSRVCWACLQARFAALVGYRSCVYSLKRNNQDMRAETYYIACHKDTF